MTNVKDIRKRSHAYIGRIIIAFLILGVNVFLNSEVKSRYSSFPKPLIAYSFQAILAAVIAAGMVGSMLLAREMSRETFSKAAKAKGFK